jgi:hypothetical protein
LRPGLATRRRRLFPRRSNNTTASLPAVTGRAPAQGRTNEQRCFPLVGRRFDPDTRRRHFYRRRPPARQSTRLPAALHRWLGAQIGQYCFHPAHGGSAPWYVVEQPRCSLRARFIIRCTWRTRYLKAPSPTLSWIHTDLARRARDSQSRVRLCCVYPASPLDPSEAKGSATTKFWNESHSNPRL